MTAYGKRLVTLCILALVIVGLFVFSSPDKPADVPEPVAPSVLQTIPSEGQYCFSYKHPSSTEEPYSVDEFLYLSFNGTKVVGTKEGTQSGPDMTNGYSGTLLGAVVNDELELTYDYTVEGADQRELEVYAFDKGNVIKKRWVLTEQKIDGKDILVPDYKGEPKIITYTAEECKP